MNTVDYVRASRKMHINTIHLGSDTPSSFTRRLAQLGQGIHAQIGENDMEMFSGQCFKSNSYFLKFLRFFLNLNL